MNTHNAIIGIVVSGKRVESPQLLPSIAQGYGSVAIEAAYISPHQRDAVKAEAQKICKRC